MPKCEQKPYPIWFSATVHRVEPAHCSQDCYTCKTISITNLSMLLSLKFVRCRARVLVKHFNGIHARSITLIHWIMVTLGIENCALHYEAIVWWSLKRTIAMSFLCTNAQCPMHNAQLPMTNCQSKLFLITYMLDDRFFKRVEVYGLFSNGAIISY